MSDKILKVNKRLDKLLDDLLNSEHDVKIGILSKDFKESKKYYDEDGTIDKSDKTLGEIAYIHEFGSGNVPERSFLRSTWDSQKRTIDKTIQVLAKINVKREDYRVEKLLESIGVFMVGKVKQTFRNNNWPPLEDPTRGGKNKSGGATPLIDTGQLINSIDYKIIEGKEK